MPRRKKQDNAETLLSTIVEAIVEKKGQRIVSMHVGKLPNAVCDYFVVCSAESTTQVDAIATNIEIKVDELLKERPWQKGGYENAIWVILDYVNVVVHVFQSEWRQFYRLEELWADAARTEHAD